MLAGVAAVVGFVFLTSIVGLIFGTGNSTKLSHAPTAAPVLKPVSGNPPGTNSTAAPPQGIPPGDSGRKGDDKPSPALGAWKLHVFRSSKRIPSAEPVVPRSSLSARDAADLAEYEGQLNLEAWKLSVFRKKMRIPSAEPVAPRGSLSAKDAAALAEYERILDKFL